MGVQINNGHVTLSIHNPFNFVILTVTVKTKKDGEIVTKYNNLLPLPFLKRMTIIIFSSIEKRVTQIFHPSSGGLTSTL